MSCFRSCCLAVLALRSLRQGHCLLLHHYRLTCLLTFSVMSMRCLRGSFRRVAELLPITASELSVAQCFLCSFVFPPPIVMMWLAFRRIVV